MVDIKRNDNTQLTDQMVSEIYEDATANGLNAKEYIMLLKRINTILDNACQTSQFWRTGTHPEPYGTDGKELRDEQ